MGSSFTGSAHALDKADEKTPINDTWLTAQTKIALAADGRVKGRQIDVETTKNVVRLRGKVDSDAATHAAEVITKMIEGVKSVKNELKVQRSSGFHDQCPSVLDCLAGPRACSL